MSSDGRRKVVILGIGNVLMRDEGAGVHAVRALAGGKLPAGVEVLDGGTLGIELLPIIEEADGLVLLDAACFGGSPGELRTFRGEALAGTYGGHISPHQAGAADLIAVARLTAALPERCTLIGVEPGEVEFGLELSEPVAAAVPKVVQAALAEAVEFSREPSHA